MPVNIGDRTAKSDSKAKSMLSETLDLGSEMKQETGSWISVKPTTCLSQNVPDNWTDDWIHSPHQMANIENI